MEDTLQKLDDLIKIVRMMRTAQKKLRHSGPASSMHEASLWENKVDFILDQHPKPAQPVQGTIGL